MQCFNLEKFEMRLQQQRALFKKTRQTKVGFQRAEKERFVRELLAEEKPNRKLLERLIQNKLSIKKQNVF